MNGTLQNDGIEKIYESPAPDFELSRLDLETDSIYQSSSKTAQIIIIIEGKVNVEEGDNSLILNRGSAFYLMAGSKYKIQGLSKAILYKATTP